MSQEGSRMAVQGRGRKQNPVTFYLRTLLYTFVGLLLRLAAFLPLGALFVFEEGSALRFLALLCPVLIALLILPLRFSFAQALVQKRRQRYFSFDTALSLSRYGEKVAEGLWHAVNVLKWAIPLAAALLGGYLFQKFNDIGKLFGGISQLGKTAGNVYGAVINFFRSVFGMEKLEIAGGLGEGLVAIGVVVMLCVLVLAIGVMRNSAYRYVWVLASEQEKNPHTETRRRLRGRRWEQLLAALCNLVLLLPPMLVVAVTFKGMLADLSPMMLLTMTSSQPELSGFASALWPMIFSFFCLYLPLLPVRRCVTAYYATRTLKHIAPEHRPEEAPVAENAGEPAQQILPQ